MPCRFNTLKLSMYVNENHFPCLKGKAAEIRHFAAPLYDVVKRHLDRASPAHRQVHLGFVLILKLEEILDDHADAHTFPQEVADEFFKCAWGFVALSSALHQFYKERVIFNYTIKFHYLLHLGLIGRHINPRLGWCYGGEDFMMKVKKLVQSSYRGSPAHIIPNKILTKYGRGLGLNLLDRAWKA